MELQHIQSLYRPNWRELAVDQWSENLQQVCGTYHAEPVRGRRSVVGLVDTYCAGGTDFAHVANDLALVRRDRSDIRNDDNEFLFLILQLSGECGIDQMDNKAWLTPGDCILVDSARPSIFSFDGKFSNQISVHLPREVMYADTTHPFATASKLDRHDPMATALRAIVAKMLMSAAVEQKTEAMNDLLFNLTRMAFALTETRLSDLTGKAPSAYVRLAEDLIDRNLNNPDLSATWIANCLNVPLRRLQEGFQVEGTTCSGLIRIRRIKLAQRLLDRERNFPRLRSITEVAYSSGFKDLSYFNRCFREAFGMTPTAYLKSKMTDA